MEEKEMDTVTKRVTFPLKVWVDFETLCTRYYGNCYWLAIKDCMEKAKVLDSIGLMKVDINNLNERLSDIEIRLEKGNGLTEAEKQMEEEPAMTMGSNPIRKGDE